MCAWIKTIVNKFAISNHTALILGVHAFISFLKLICEYELHNLPNIKVSGAKDHGKKSALVRHILRNRLFSRNLGMSRILFYSKNVFQPQAIIFIIFIFVAVNLLLAAL